MGNKSFFDIKFIPKMKDLLELEDVSYVSLLANDELLFMLGPHQYDRGYKLGVALSKEYIKRFYGNQLSGQN